MLSSPVAPKNSIFAFGGFVWSGEVGLLAAFGEGLMVEQPPAGMLPLLVYGYLTGFDSDGSVEVEVELMVLPALTGGFEDRPFASCLSFDGLGYPCLAVVEEPLLLLSSPFRQGVFDGMGLE